MLCVSGKPQGGDGEPQNEQGEGGQQREGTAPLRALFAAQLSPIPVRMKPQDDLLEVLDELAAKAMIVRRSEDLFAAVLQWNPKRL